MTHMMPPAFPFFWVYLPETSDIHEKMDALTAHMSVFSESSLHT